MIKKKLFIISIVVIIALIGGLVFLSSAKQERKEIEAIMNSTYTEYRENPEAFKLTKAEILEEYDCETGERINFFDVTNQWLVKIKIDENTSCHAYVMRDVKKDNIGDIIDVAYKINSNNNYADDNINATQLKYIEETSSMRSYNILIFTISLFLVAAVGYLLYSVIKSK